MDELIFAKSLFVDTIGSLMAKYFVARQYGILVQAMVIILVEATDSCASDGNVFVLKQCICGRVVHNSCVKFYGCGPIFANCLS